MLIVYLSLTGNIRNFVERTDMDSLELNYSNPIEEVRKAYVVISPTYDDEITDVISEFLEYKDNLQYLQGFIGSGDKNFNSGYVFNAIDLSKKYKKPLIFKFEKNGTDAEVLKFKEEVQRIEVTRTK